MQNKPFWCMKIESVVDILDVFPEIASLPMVARNDNVGVSKANSMLDLRVNQSGRKKTGFILLAMISMMKSGYTGFISLIFSKTSSASFL